MMAQTTNEQKRSRNPQNKHKISSYSEPKTQCNHANESRSKKKRFVFLKLKGLGCKGTSLPVSTPGIILTAAAEWENKGARNKNQKKRRKQLLHNNNQRNTTPNNVVVDVNDVCCKPPGIGIASDFVPSTRNPAPRFHQRKHSREARRNEDEPSPNFPAVLSGGNGSRANHRSAEEIIEILMSRQTMQPARIFQRNDQYQDWRLNDNVDNMSYEELLDLSERIGYVGTGLHEEEISSCLRKSKHFKLESTSMLITDHREWKCSICQEKHRDDDIGTLECGHHHHVECIKQWLQHKNACPVCKSAAMPDRS